MQVAVRGLVSTELRVHTQNSVAKVDESQSVPTFFFDWVRRRVLLRENRFHPKPCYRGRPFLVFRLIFFQLLLVSFSPLWFLHFLSSECFLSFCPRARLSCDYHVSCDYDVTMM